MACRCMLALLHGLSASVAMVAQPPDGRRLGDPEQPGRVVYVDLGARQGDTIAWYLHDRKLHNWARDPRPVAIWAWEVDPKNLGVLRQRVRALNQDQNFHFREKNTVTIVEKAAWISEGSTAFMRDTRVNAKHHMTLSGGSLLDTPFNNASDTMQVATADFSQWLLSHTSVGDKVTVKMDIEGAEFRILDKMATDGSISRVRSLYIEIHEWFFSYADGGLAPGAERYSGTSRRWRDIEQKLRALAPDLEIVVKKDGRKVAAQAPTPSTKYATDTAE